MKRIIKNRVYDTDTATRVAEWESGYDVSDFTYTCETLYRKRNGEYFLHGESGPAGRYAVSAGQNAWRGGESIMPIGYEQARTWAEEHLDADDYEREFGEVTEEGEVMLSLRVSAAAKAALDRHAVATGRAKGEIVESLLLGIG